MSAAAPPIPELAAGLDLEYIHGLGTYAAEFLARGESVILGFEPGNGTHYDLAFTPLRGAYSLISPVKLSTGPAFPTGDAARRDRWAIVSWLNHGAYLFPLLLEDGIGADPGYIAGKFQHATVSDGAAFSVLFSAIAQAAHVSTELSPESPVTPDATVPELTVAEAYRWAEAARAVPPERPASPDDLCVLCTQALDASNHHTSPYRDGFAHDDCIDEEEL